MRLIVTTTIIGNTVIYAPCCRYCRRHRSLASGVCELMIRVIANVPHFGEETGGSHIERQLIGQIALIATAIGFQTVRLSS